MKLQINLLIGLIIILSSCKTFRGDYCTLPSYTGACIEFLNKKELLYNTATDYGAFGINYGKYRIKKDTLIVEFSEIPKKYRLKKNDKYEIVNFTTTEKDSSEFDLTCEGVWFADVYCKSIKSDSIVFGYNTNLDGKLNFKLENDQIPLKLIAEYGTSKVEIPINNIGAYEIQITLNELAGKVSYNNRMWTTSKFLTKKGENDIIYFEQIGNEEWGKYYKY